MRIGKRDRLSVEETNVPSTTNNTCAIERGDRRSGRLTTALATVVAVCAAGLASAGLAASAQAAAEFDVSASGPLLLYPGGQNSVKAVIVNSGDVAMADGSVTVTFSVPAPLSAIAVNGGALGTPPSPVYGCVTSDVGHTVTCTGPDTTPLGVVGIMPGFDACDYDFGFGLGGPRCPISITVRADLTASLGVYPVGVTASGGGAPTASTQVPVRVKNYGDDFGLAPINDGAGPADDSIAYGDATKAFWAGACDISAAPVTAPFGSPIGGTGVGTRSSMIQVPNPAKLPEAGYAPAPAPVTPSHCIDWGSVLYAVDRLWEQAPAWRLPGLARAGSHPDGTASMLVAREGAGGNQGEADGSVDNIIVDIPPGFVGNPEAVPTCSNEVFAKIPTRCPPETQVGVINLDLKAAGVAGGDNLSANHDALHPIWNLEPRKGKAAEFGFSYASNQKAVSVRLVGKVRSGSDNGVTAMVGQIPAPLPLVGQAATLWGIPWEAANDKWRAPEDLRNASHPCNFQPPGFIGHYIPWSGFTAPGCAQSYDPSWGPIKPFLTQETDCNQNPVTSVWLDSYQHPGALSGWGEPDRNDLNWETASSPSPAVQDCASLGFSPDIEFTATTESADGASGLTAELSIPQNNDAKDNGGSLLPVPAEDASPSEVAEYVQDATDFFDSGEGRGTAHLKDTVVTLPSGMSVNPSGAIGLEACSDAVVGVRVAGDPPLFNTNDPSDGLGGDDCPHGSLIGTVEVDTPLLDQPLSGDVILGEPKSTDPTSGEMFRMFLIVRNVERGLLVKVYGTATSDPDTGRITARFRNNPELPFSDLRLDVKGGDRGLLATPRNCGDAGWTSAFTPWSSVGAATPVADTPDSGALSVGANCANAFAPSLAAGMDTQAARANGTFSFRFSRRDGEQYLRGLTAKLPQGLLASVKDVPLCSNAQANAGTCPAGSKIGIVDAKAGAGDPFVLEEKGEVFLTEGYKGGEYGLAVKVRPIAGPFRDAMELSPIIVRQAIHVDRTSAQVTAVSDPFPLIHHGVPLRVREVTVLVNRDKFMLNPSDCTGKQIGADIASDQGATSNASNPFQAAGCPNLAFKPTLALQLTGRKQVKTGKHPGIRAVVTQQGVPEAGIEKAVVRLPKSLALDVNNAQALCEYVDGIKPDIENHCPTGSIVGRARAVSPLLNDPLVGNVYFVKNVRVDAKTGNQIRTLPMIIVALRGEISVNLKGESDTTKSGKLVNTFNNVPDAPISQFNLNINGGSKGIIAVTRTRRSLINLCASGRQIAEADMDGQNGRRHDFDISMRKPCTKAQTKAAKRKAKRAAARRAAAGRRR